MNIVDLSQPLYDHMPVYPGDPEVIIKRVSTLEKDGWNMNVLTFPTHIGTHVNIPIHAVNGGKTLDDYSPDAFLGSSVVYSSPGSIQQNIGLLFENTTISKEIVDIIIKTKPKFIGVGGYFESDRELEIEKVLLKNEIISFEGLVNIEKLPKNQTLTFYGVPLKIKDGDGSPVRAFATI